MIRIAFVVLITLYCAPVIAVEQSGQGSTAVVFVSDDTLYLLSVHSEVGSLQKAFAVLDDLGPPPLIQESQQLYYEWHVQVYLLLQEVYPHFPPYIKALQTKQINEEYRIGDRPGNVAISIGFYLAYNNIKKIRELESEGFRFVQALFKPESGNYYMIFSRD